MSNPVHRQILLPEKCKKLLQCKTSYNFSAKNIILLQLTVSLKEFSTNDFVKLAML